MLDHINGICTALTAKGHATKPLPGQNERVAWVSMCCSFVHGINPAWMCVPSNKSPFLHHVGKGDDPGMNRSSVGGQVPLHSDGFTMGFTWGFLYLPHHFGSTKNSNIRWGGSRCYRKDRNTSGYDQQPKARLRTTAAQKNALLTVLFISYRHGKIQPTYFIHGLCLTRPKISAKN